MYDALNVVFSCRADPLGCDVGRLDDYASGSLLDAIGGAMDQHRTARVRATAGPAERHRVTAIELADTSATVTMCEHEASTYEQLDEQGTPAGSLATSSATFINIYAMVVGGDGRWRLDSLISSSPVEGDLTCD